MASGYKSLIEARTDAKAASKGKITSKRDFIERLKFFLRTSEKVSEMSCALTKTRDEVDNLCDVLTTYAFENKKQIFDGEPTRDGNGILHGYVSDEKTGTTYNYTGGWKGFVRTNGEKITQEFLATLPKEWTRGKNEINGLWIKAHGVTSEQLEKAGIVHKANDEWSESKVKKE